MVIEGCQANHRKHSVPGLDYQVNESFLDTAVEYDNVRRLARQYGYKFTGRPAAFGFATFYVIVPANSSGLGPNA